MLRFSFIQSDYLLAGRNLTILPLEPELGKMLILGAILNCLDPVQTVVTGLSVRDHFLDAIGQERCKLASKSYVVRWKLYALCALIRIKAIFFLLKSLISNFMVGSAIGFNGLHINALHFFLNNSWIVIERTSFSLKLFLSRLHLGSGTTKWHASGCHHSEVGNNWHC